MVSVTSFAQPENKEHNKRKQTEEGFTSSPALQNIAVPRDTSQAPWFKAFAQKLYEVIFSAPLKESIQTAPPTKFHEMQVIWDFQMNHFLKM